MFLQTAILTFIKRERGLLLLTLLVANHSDLTVIPSSAMLTCWMTAIGWWMDCWQKKRSEYLDNNKHLYIPSTVVFPWTFRRQLPPWKFLALADSSLITANGRTEFPFLVILERETVFGKEEDRMARQLHVLLCWKNIWRIGCLSQAHGPARRPRKKEKNLPLNNVKDSLN